MNHGRMRLLLLAIATALATLVPASIASASIAPTVTLDQSAGTQAAGTANLGVDIKFNPSTGAGDKDTVKDLTLKLPAGLLANASIDGGACLQSSTPMPACEVGTANLYLVGATEPLAATFDLVAPPKAGDLAGLQLVAGTLTEGTPADVVLRPTGDPDGVGLDISFQNIVNNLFGTIPIYVSEIQSTFNGMLYPSLCPSKQADVKVIADSYIDPNTPEGAQAPLEVTGCKTAPYSPKVTVTATQDAGDNGVDVTTEVSQAANQSSSSSIQFVFPVASLYANVTGASAVLCTGPTSGCTPVGSATGVSPTYPTALSGKVYLTGSILQPQLEIVFPPPFPITLAGNVDLATNSATFTGIPDIPLTDLKVELTGGPDSVYDASCNPAKNAVTATLVSQSGDETVGRTAPFTVTPCTASPATTGTITPGVTLDQSAGTQAASTANLGVNLSFAVTGNDSVRDLTLALPAGLLANASVDGGACLSSASPIAACQVGTGTVSADGVVSLPASFDLVAPPAAGDLAGLQLMLQGSPLGSPADVYLRTGAAATADGTGLDIAFTSIPDTFEGIPIQVTGIDSTFDGLRYPSSCPSTPATVQVSADSYADPMPDATPKTASAPLSVTGCSKAPYAPKYALTAVEDSADKGVTLTTTVTQAADELTSSQISLDFPAASLYANAFGVASLECPTNNGTTTSGAACPTIGSATAVSPDYPAPLVGKVYLANTGSSALTPNLVLKFPAPFALTLLGSVNVTTNATVQERPGYSADDPQRRSQRRLDLGLSRRLLGPIRHGDGRVHRSER